MTGDALTEIWPVFGLRLATPRLELRLPREHELPALAAVAAGGVHGPGERPFLTPWTDGSPAERAAAVLRGHWERLAGWRPEAWALGLGVFRDGTAPVGVATLRARDFAVTREVATASWLGLAHHGRGFGTEARAALLTLAFDHLGASDAVSEAFGDNHASLGVSRKLGYRPDGISRDGRGGEVLVSARLRLTACRWVGVDRPAVRVTGLDAARALFTGG